MIAAWIYLIGLIPGFFFLSCMDDEETAGEPLQWVYMFVWPFLLLLVPVGLMVGVNHVMTKLYVAVNKWSHNKWPDEKIPEAKVIKNDSP